MFKLKAVSFAMVAFAAVWNVPDTAEAGPLLDWFLGRRCCRPGLFRPHQARCQQPVVAASPACGTCQTTCMQTCQKTVVNYVPYTAYRTSWECVPVTSYRPQSNTDPCTGCTVTCMKPCTSYSYRAKQTPYTTYRPVYSTQAYQVPITYTSQMPVQAPFATGGCDSCGVAGVQPGIQYQGGTVPTITGTLNTDGTYITTPANGIQVPADTQPQLNPQLQQKPIIIQQSPTPAYGTSSRLNAPANQQNWPSNSNLNPINVPSGNGQGDQNQAPQLFDVEAKTARANSLDSAGTISPVFQQFDYSPVRTASHTEPALYDTGSYVKTRNPQTDDYSGTIQRSGIQSSVNPNSGNPNSSNAVPQRLNEGWRSLAK